MEITPENVNKVAEVLTSGKFNSYLETVQAMIEDAKDFMKRHPEVESLEELKELYDKEQDKLNISQGLDGNSNESKGKDTEDSKEI